MPTPAQVRARDYVAYQGKVLRLTRDGEIRANNPVIEGVRSHVISYGHHNPKRLAFGPGGTLFPRRAGADTDDEIDVITAGDNYG